MPRRLLPLAVALLAAVAAPLLVAVPAQAEPAAAEAGDVCEVNGGRLDWGFKESFRSYISGTIASGSWEPIAPATYATPVFSWPVGTGTFDPATGAGTVSFAGGVRFTGHDGLLDTTIANPTLVLPGDGTAQLLLDVTGVSMEDAMAGAGDAAQTASQIPFVDLDLPAAPLSVTADAVTGTAVATAITEQGFAEFGSYETGTAFDPVTFTLALACVRAEATPTPSASPEAALPADDLMAVDETATLWAWLAPVLIVVAAGALVAVLLVRRRRGGRS